MISGTMADIGRGIAKNNASSVGTSQGDLSFFALKDAVGGSCSFRGSLKTQALNLTYCLDKSLHNPSPESKQKADLQREG